jgi:hypothetical protein
MTRQIRIRTKYRTPLDEDQLALAFLLLAKQVREEARKGSAKKSRRDPKRRAA